MKLLIDADYIVYKSCAGAEDEIDFGEDVILVISKFSEALSNVQRELSKIKNNFMWDTPELVLFFSDSKNFRKKICPDYKGHRNRKKPCGYRRVLSMHWFNTLTPETLPIIIGMQNWRHSLSRRWVFLSHSMGILPSLCHCMDKVSLSWI